MDALHAGRILERLAGHWPSIAVNDAAADDWVEAIITTTDKVATEAATTLVTGWRKDRPPRIADWYETCAQVAPRVTTPMHALPAAPTPEPTDEQRAAVAELVAKAKDGLANAERFPVSDQPVKVSRYDRPASPRILGDKHMTPEEREAELERFGDRKVRRRSA